MTEPLVPADMTNTIVALLRLPARVLGKPRRGGSRRLTHAELIDRELRNTNVPEELIRDAQKISNLPKSANSKSSADCPRSVSASPSADVDVAAVRQRAADRAIALRAQRKLVTGHSNRASRELASTDTLADINDASVLQRLRDLHPSLPSSSQIPSLPSAAVQVQIEAETLQQLMLKSDNGSSPGPSGWGSNMLSVLAHDPECVDAMRVLVERIVNDQLPDTVRQLLTASSLIALTKPNGGVRPIAMGELFYRVAAQYAMSLIRLDARKALAPHQYGVGQSDGCAQIVHSLQHQLTQAGNPLACLSIDMANAFNSCDRAAIMTSVFRNPVFECVWRMVAFGYSRPSMLLVRQQDDCHRVHHELIQSQNGVRQGDPLSAFLFSLAVHSAYSASTRVTGTQCLAYMDDCNMVGSPERCLQALDILELELGSIGLRVNRAKCSLTSFWDIDGVTEREFDSRGIPVHHEHSWLLGTVIGKSNAAIMAAVDDADNPWLCRRARLWRRLPHLSKQNQLLVLQHAGVAGLNHQMRCLPPATFEHQARAHDELIASWAERVLGVDRRDLPHMTWQLALPTSLGGFGLYSTVAISPIAYIAGVVNSLRWAPILQLWTKVNVYRGRKN